MTPLPAIGPRLPLGNRDALSSAVLVVENSRSYAEMVAGLVPADAGRPRPQCPTPTGSTAG